MHSIQVHKVINQLISFYYRIGFWHQGDQLTAKEFGIKALHSIYYLLFIVSLTIGTITNENTDESIFLAEGSILATVMLVKVFTFIWKQNQILDLLNRICVFSICDDEDLKLYNEKLGKLMRFVNPLLSVSLLACCLGTGLSPFVGSERTLFFKIAFPLDWKNNGISFWIADVFVLFGALFSIIGISFSIIIWYLMIHCALRLEVLGSDLSKLGQKKIPKQESENMFLQNLIASIDAHMDLKEIINEMEKFCSNLFFLQLATSGVCICASIYCLAFDINDNFFGRMVHFYSLFYNIAEIFMITYFGNEIMLASNRLSYSLFESDWSGQPESTKMLLIIFGECLKRPHELVVAKLYPLTLETFTRILNSAYSMFNILKNFHQ